MSSMSELILVRGFNVNINLQGSSNEISNKSVGYTSFFKWGGRLIFI